MQKIIASLVLSLAAVAAQAEKPQSVTLNIQNMTCSMCPITVKKALDQMPGVSRTSIDFEKKTATVAFDADRTSAAALTKATTDAGYPSTVRK